MTWRDIFLIALGLCLGLLVLEFVTRKKRGD